MSGRYRSTHGDIYNVRYIPARDEFYLVKSGSAIGTFISEEDLREQVRSGWLTLLISS